MFQPVFALVSLSVSIAAGASAPPAVRPDVVRVQPGAEAPPPKQLPGAAKPLALGDAAPALGIETWLKGGPVSALEKGTVYVIEFWSPTSAGSAANMPRLTELQKKYQDKGVTVIGIVSKDPRSGLEAGQKAVSERADAIGYAVAWDPDRAAFRTYVEASGSKFLPTTFIVDRAGAVAHIQSGTDSELDKPLSQIVAGTYSIRRAEERGGRTGGAARNGPSGIGVIRGAANRGAWNDMMVAYEALSERDRPAGADEVFDALLLRKKDYRAASDFGRRAVEGVMAQNSRYLNELAWAIVNPANEVEGRDLDLALKAATRADELTGGKNASIIDTVARVHFWKGDLVKAIELQRKSVAAITAGDLPETRDEVEATLREYEQAIKKQ